MSQVSLQIPEQFNVAVELVDKNLQLGRGDKVAIYYQDQTFTYEQVFRLVNKAGNALKSLGVERENRVLLLLLDSPEFVATFFGAIKMGAVPIPTNTILKAQDYLYLLNDSRAKVAVVSEALVPVLESIRGELRYLEHLVVAGQAGPGQMSYDELIQAASDELEPADTHKDEPAFWLYSSGSTGFPKGAVHLQHDMIVSADLYAKPILNINENDICYSVAKLFFAYGLGNALYFPFRVGASTVLVPEAPKPETVFAAVRRYQPTLFYGVPTSYSALLQAADRIPDVDMHSIRLCTSAGESLPKSVYEAWRKKFNLIILDGIGSTEITHIFITNRLGEAKPGSTGKPVPGYEAKLVDAEGNPVPTGEIGTLMVKGDSICAYYWNKHEKNKQSFCGPWINTGDKYLIDEEGFFWYVGRTDDMIKPGGIWVSPIEVENTLMEHPSILECAVIGVRDSDNLEKPKAYVVLKEGFSASTDLAKEIQQFVKSRIAPYKFPRWVEFVEELPKTASGKMLRYRLRQLNQPAGTSARADETEEE
ncbi:AMP-dependent synthetase/ligase [Acididesulfobacillus acetoxydans]|uniref:AMP-dependent synthetase/ligase n=1 Tax=Acididesulfobacillus acetoxydans TaxID=1561005 RepID=A0A8S0W2X9_9FIRM|nr:benzoate-CoA ligase family protein [Acididesulfobacillus acetoxydans]CAA7601108.1 AMP-dependent synthetase/ligase [Acididesulfobacillus acetoxydans]CEJ07145.1 Benzoate--CoA ligase [Acididesulfobacillus acetoxydans]